MKKNKPTTFFWREIEHKYHNDRPLYWTMGILISFFSIILLAIVLNT